MAAKRAQHQGQRKTRVVWVDVFRLLATFQMVQGHTLDAVLADDLRSGMFFEAWRAVRGLTAVSFLFLAGVAFSLATLQDLPAHRADQVGQRRRVRRGLGLLGLGYLLHLPLGQLADVEAALREWLVVDVLHCIGLSLLALQLLVALCSRARHVEAIAAVIGCALLGAAALPPLPAPAGGLAPFTSYLTAAGGSIFPVLPWAGYMFVGVAVAGWLRGRALAGVALRLLGLAAACLALAAISAQLGQPRLHEVTQRTGAVLVVALLLALATARLRGLPRPLQVLSAATLFIYVFHILLVYVAGLGLAQVVGPVLALGPALQVTLLVLVVSAGLSLFRARLRARPQTLARASGTG